LSPIQGEIKSMRTPLASRRQGAGRVILLHIVQEARRRGYQSLDLETGAHPGFEAAHALYRSVGFEAAGPFGPYEANPNSVFMSLSLGAGAPPR
jgi:putative acetyltransferase